MRVPRRCPRGRYKIYALSTKNVGSSLSVGHNDNWAAFILYRHIRVYCHFFNLDICVDAFVQLSKFLIVPKHLVLLLFHTKKKKKIKN